MVIRSARTPGEGRKVCEIGVPAGRVPMGVDTGAEVEKIMLDFCSKATGLRWERLTEMRQVWLSLT